MKKIYLFIFLNFIYFVNLLFAFDNTNITFVTYYPSPRATYKELRTRRIAVGDNVQAYAFDANTDLYVTGNVGIGTKFPAATLDVNGTVRIDDGLQIEGRVLMSNAHGEAFWSDRMELSNFFATFYNTTQSSTPALVIKPMGKHLFCFLSGVLPMGQFQACQCQINLDASGNWTLERTAGRVGGDTCACEAHCLDKI